MQSDSDKIPSPATVATDARGKPKRRQSVGERIVWSLGGAVLNYLLISFPFKYLKAHTDWSASLISHCSIGVSTLFFFPWNYYVNFRGDSRRRYALLRYVIAVLLMWKLSSMTLSYLKQHDFHHAFSLGTLPIDLDVVATQFFLGGLKFMLYHFWVFPAGKKEKPQKMKAATEET